MSRTGSSDSTLIVPRSGRRSPSTHSIVVVLPAPFGPISPKISSRWTSNDTSSTATSRPYRLRMPETRMTDIEDKGNGDGVFSLLVAEQRERVLAEIEGHGRSLSSGRRTPAARFSMRADRHNPGRDD